MPTQPFDIGRALRDYFSERQALWTGRVTQTELSWSVVRLGNYRNAVRLNYLLSVNYYRDAVRLSSEMGNMVRRALPCHHT